MTTPSPGSHPHIDPGADRCPECGGYAQRGCGAAWHDGKPDTHCPPACQCRADIKADLRYWHDQAVTQEARAAEAVADRDRLAARIETLEGAARLAERALRDQPMQAFRTAEAQRRRAAAIDALRALVAPDTPCDDCNGAGGWWEGQPGARIYVPCHACAPTDSSGHGA